MAMVVDSARNAASAGESPFLLMVWLVHWDFIAVSTVEELAMPSTCLLL
jgi:hypothetical protein